MLWCASGELKAKKEIVLEAVKQYGWGLEIASGELKADKEVAFEAVKKKKGGFALVSLRGAQSGQTDGIRSVEAERVCDPVRLQGAQGG